MAMASRIPAPSGSNRRHTNNPQSLSAFMALLNAESMSTIPAQPEVSPQQDPQGADGQMGTVGQVGSSTTRDKISGKKPTKKKPTGKITRETALEKRHKDAHARLATVDPERAEQYALAIMSKAMDRRSCHPLPGPHARLLTIVVDVQDAKEARKVREEGEEGQKGKAGKAKKGRGKKTKMSQWERSYVETFGSVCGIPVLLIESIGAGTGILEFGNVAATT